MLRTILPVMLAYSILTILPVADAHASPDPLDVEVQVLADETDDTYYAQVDGFDIQDLYVREAHLDQGDGIVLRIYLFGGPGAVSTTSSYAVEMEASGPTGDAYTARITSTDGKTWSGDGIVEQAIEASDEGGLQGYVQVLIPYTALGASMGDSITGFKVRSFADADLRDVAPGGRPIPGTNGMVEDPTAQGNSRVVTESITLKGAVGYTTTKVQTDGGHVTLEVQNRITSTGQHIKVEQRSDDWTLEGLNTAGRPVDAGVHPTFQFNATGPADANDLILWITTDVGGKEVVSIPAASLHGTGPGNHEDTGNDTTGPEKDSPGPTLPALLLALTAMVLLTRRR